ncbi:xanthine dehydrogenase accessory factor [Sphaerisporangium rufum]|uniref:Xanthine dehydrogenase accessory factor n=1 Tax=Sphaerisporangium rufum TaxID=1381558 RepID=A0A919UX20_9ACTN|nr:XdhC family protein [Sphaerisporangium rufum]GII75389.1 xanthine dehydrogenase accessory factor [Sphaerisporangium rufum]
MADHARPAGTDASDGPARADTPGWSARADVPGGPAGADSPHHGSAAAGTDPACAAAHGEIPVPPEGRTLVAVFASPVAGHLLRYGTDIGYHPLLLEPDAERAAAVGEQGLPVATAPPAWLDGTVDVVVTDHDRAELGMMLRDLLALHCRWIGVMGSPRHTAPHLAALAELGVPDADIARVHRPIGLNIGSRTPPEIAIATLAGLIADRNGRPGGFTF